MRISRNTRHRVAHGRALLSALPIVGSLFVAAPAQATTATCAAAGITVSALHGANATFYVDSTASPRLGSAYAGFLVSPTTAVDDLWLSIDGANGGSISAAASQPMRQRVGYASTSAPAPTYVYLTASSTTTSAQTMTYSLWRGDPTLPTSVRSCTFTNAYARVSDTIKASSNKITGVTVSDASPSIGQTITVTATGNTGTIGSGPATDPGVLTASLSQLDTWPAGAVQLLDTAITIDQTGSSGATTRAHALRIDSLSGPARPYTVVYSLRLTAPTPSAVTISPVQNIASGTQMKHTDTAGSTLGGFAAPVNELTMTMTAAATASGASYGIVVHNGGADAAILSDAWTTIDAGALVNGSATVGGTSVADPVANAGSLVFAGPLAVPPGSDLTIAYQVTACTGSHQATAIGHIGATLIDATLPTTDNSPASASVVLSSSTAAGCNVTPVTTPTTSTTSTTVGASTSTTASTTTTSAGGSSGGGSTFAIADAGFGTGATCPATLDEDRLPPVAVTDIAQHSVPTVLYQSTFGSGNIGAFQQLSGHWLATGGTYTQEDTCGFDYTALLTTPAVEHFRLSATFHATGQNQGGIVFNQTTNATRSSASVVDLTQGGSVLRWGHYNAAGYYTYEGSTSITAPTSGQSVTITVDVHGTAAAITYGGTQVATMTNVSPRGYVGLLANQSTVGFESVTLTGLPAA